MNEKEISEHIYRAKHTMLKMANQCGKGVHLGGAFSMIDMLTVLFAAKLNFHADDPLWEGRDRFVLSKGHCAVALYSVLAEFGIISRETLEEFMKDDSKLTCHPIRNEALGIESSTGSLGQGVSIATGLAKAAKILGEESRVYTMVGNGECNEGSVWESAMLASSIKLDNLVVLLDQNNQQNDGFSDKVLTVQNVTDRWKSFGFDVFEIDGHNIQQIKEALDKATAGIGNEKPKIIIGNTVKGHGISFMENDPTWHHNRLTRSGYEKAAAELETRDDNH